MPASSMAGWFLLSLFDRVIGSIFSLQYPKSNSASSVGVPEKV